MDKYAFLRDAYLQRRRSLIYDGNPPSSGAPGESPRRKTLKEMEEELDEPLPPEK
jgi:phospholipid-binding lipoprotein MlaA